MAEEITGDIDTEKSPEGEKILLAGVATEKTAYHFDKIFEYRVPEKLIDCCIAGCRAVVPFGRGNVK